MVNCFWGELIVRICILGHRGMLGNTVARYLEEQGCHVITISQRFLPSSPQLFLEELQAAKPEWCINCIGLSPKQAKSDKQLFEINALLPELLVANLRPEVGIIQPSTDGVFGAMIPKRHVTDIPDAVDDYGLSKLQAEKAMTGDNSYIIRCSIIGLELGTTRSLLNWFLSQPNSVSGYTNHYWNGITTLEWAKLCYRIISNQTDNHRSTFQPGFEPPITKYELLTLIGEIWGHSVKVNPVEAGNPVLRTLIPNVKCPPLILQLNELKLWYSSKLNES